MYVYKSIYTHLSIYLPKDVCIKVHIFVYTSAYRYIKFYIHNKIHPK